MKVFKISQRFQWIVFAVFTIVGIWTAYSYQLYSASDRIISYQEKKLGETRSAYVDLMSDFLTVHKNIASLVGNIERNDEKKSEDVDAYLKRAEVIEEKIRQITAKETWIDAEDLGKKSELKDALIGRDVALEEKRALEEKVRDLEEVISSLQAFEMDILRKVETISNKEIEKVKSSISGINSELKKRGKYFNPLANSKKNNRGGKYEPASAAISANEEMMALVNRAFTAADDQAYYREMIKKVPLGKPVWTYWLSSPFGKRSDPFNAKSARHKGVDLASNKGNKVKTMAEGKVVRAGLASGYGKLIEIDHGNGFKTKYAHLNAIYVTAGQEVSQGQAIGEVGSTGRSTGPHLHYEVLFDGVPVDPMAFIKAK